MESPAASGVAEWRLTAVPLIGTEVGGGPDEFGDIVDLEIGEDGSVFVLDGANSVIQVFDAAGAHVRTVGGAGGGPGELADPVALAWGPEGGLWVVDPRNARYTVYATDGELVATHRRALFGFWLPWPGGFSPDGLLYDVAAMPGERPQLVEYELVEDELVERRRRALPWEPTVFEVARDGMRRIQMVPFASQPVFRIGPGGRLWHARTGEPWVYRRPPFGGEELRFGHAFEPPPLTAAERQAVLEAEMVAELRSIGRETFREFTSLIPERKPHLQGFFFDDERRVWVMRTPADGSDGAASTLDVYQADGTRIAVAEATLASDPWPRVRNGVLVGAVRDELGVEYVARFEVP